MKPQTVILLMVTVLKSPLLIQANEQILLAENFTKNGNLSWQLSAYLQRKWSKEFKNLTDTLTNQIISLNATRLELPTANAFLNMLKRSFSYFKEWAGIGVLTGLMVLASLVCLWYICRIWTSQHRNAAMIIQAFTAIETGQSPQIWLATLKDC